ncbi:hypothetical protein PT285_06890 [Lactobacillus sp. ESL0791]|uniref:hypothetical protein n=1 Tax=Lactobacillus sp. ESL0791 TaxID=2983234 RepID=UPI0023F8A2D8|nr:hypothetical protein [Lactobacillus sp. ESL0791]MDF7639126.1 hypothetical protein [Lactobacillus sp. ESL0791]
MTKINKVVSLGHNNYVVLTKDILQKTGLTAGSKVSISTEKRNGHVAVIIEPLSSPTLAEKYAKYHGTPTSYEYSDGLHDWQNAKLKGKELL